MLFERSASDWSIGARGRVDRAFIQGIGLSLALILISVSLSGSWMNFLDIPSLAIVFGGTIGATLANFSAKEISGAQIMISQTLRGEIDSPRDRISEFVRLAQLVKHSGILSLEEVARVTDDSLMRKGLELIADGQNNTDVRHILEIERDSMREQSFKAVQILEAMAQYAPSMGLLGTLIGLIQMLSQLSDPTAIGGAMAIALVTTFYGVLLSNVFLIPLAGKVRNRVIEQELLSSITLEGISALSRQESYLLMEQRLFGFIPKYSQVG